MSWNEIRPWSRCVRHVTADIVITLDKHTVSQAMKPASIRSNTVQRTYLCGKYRRSYSRTPEGFDSGQIPSGNKFSNCAHSMPVDMSAARKLCVCVCVKIAGVYLQDSFCTLSLPIRFLWQIA